MNQIPILEIDGVLISTSILTEPFCCDLDACHGACCVDGDAGAPVTLDEIGEIEEALDAVWPHLSASAQAVIDRQGVAYTDVEGELVTSLVNGKDCVFTCYDTIDNTSIDSQQSSTKCCLCALEKVCREGLTNFSKPISCALYPIREKRFAGGLVGLNYHRWEICEPARKKGQALGLPLYRFLREPLIRRFGEKWYAELEDVARELEAEESVL